MGAESEIRDALTNLIFNAVDAMPEGGTLTVRTFAQPGRRDIADSCESKSSTPASAWTKRRARRCLEPFFTTKGERGTGLGLAMVYGMVQRHSAELEIESAVGKGTTMQIGFAAYTQPINASKRVAESSHGAAATARAAHRRRSDHHQGARGCIRRRRPRDRRRERWAAGLAKFAAAQGTENSFTLVVTDLGMPDIDGRRVAEGVKHLSPQTPVIMLTGWGAHAGRKGSPSQRRPVASKPPRLQELRIAIRELFG